MKKMKVVVWVLVLLLLAGCGTPAVTPSATAKPSDEAVVKATESAAGQETDIQKYYSKAATVIPVTQNMKSGGPDVVWEKGDSNETLKGAQVFVATLPIIITYPFLQKYFISGITVGSIKE